MNIRQIRNTIFTFAKPVAANDYSLVTLLMHLKGFFPVLSFRVCYPDDLEEGVIAALDFPVALGSV